MSKVIITACLMALSLNGYASVSSGAHEVGIPDEVIYQLINVSIIFALGFYFLKDMINSAFEQKHKEYIEAKQKAVGALDRANQEHHEVHTKLSSLQANKGSTILRAQADAIEMKKQLLADAAATAARMKSETELFAKHELLKAKNHLRESLLAEAFVVAKKDITASATSEDQIRLQKEFITKVQVAR